MHILCVIMNSLLFMNCLLFIELLPYCLSEALEILKSLCLLKIMLSGQIVEKNCKNYLFECSVSDHYISIAHRIHRETPNSFIFDQVVAIYSKIASPLRYYL